MAFRDQDGANSLGDHPFSSISAPTNSSRYQDYTNYFPVNRPCNTTVPRAAGDCSSGGNVVSINKWEPLTTPQFKNGSGTPATKGFIVPHMCNVRLSPCNLLLNSVLKALLSLVKLQTRPEELLKSNTLKFYGIPALSVTGRN